MPRLSLPPSPLPVRAVLFDFDGTLFDASEAIHRSFNAALRDAGHAAWPMERLLPLIGRPLFEMFRIAVPDSTSEQREEWIRIYRAVFLPISVTLTRPLPGLHACIAALRKSGCTLGIVTNRSGPGARPILAGFQLADAFETVVGLDDVTRTKPDPEPVLLALARLGAPAKTAVLVGDTPEDMTAACAAGVRAIGVLTGSSSAESLVGAGAWFVLPDLTALPDRLLEAGPSKPVRARSAGARSSS
jgi:2-phosphoglycolate phosphatase